MTGPTQRGWKRGDSLDGLVTREWLVTNGLGGYASGTIGGACTRRFHGKLVAALPAPLGRTMMLNHLDERLGEHELGGAELLDEFALESGTPVWRYAANGIRLDKRVLMPYGQNTTYIIYRLVEAPANVTLQIRPSLNFRAHEGLLHEFSPAWNVRVDGTNIEITESEKFPPLRLALLGRTRFVEDVQTLDHVLYQLEKSRGYEHEGPLWSPGVIHLELAPGEK